MKEAAGTKQKVIKITSDLDAQLFDVQCDLRLHSRREVIAHLLSEHERINGNGAKREEGVHVF